MSGASPKVLLHIACLVTFLSCLGLALPYPLLSPLFAADSQSALTRFMDMPPKLLLGIALAINPLGILLGSAVLGSLSDRFGRRRILLHSLVLAMGAYALTALALWQEQYLLFLLARFASGLCEGNIAIARAIVAELHPHIERAKAFGWLNSVNFLGWLIGPLVGGLTMGYGITVPFWIAALAMLPCLALVWRALPDVRPAPVTSLRWQEVLWRENAFSLLAEPPVRIIFSLQLLWTLGLNAFYEFYPLWLVEALRYGSREIGFATALLCLLMTLTSALLWPRLSRHLPSLPAMQLAALLFSVTLASLPLAGAIGLPLLIIACGLPIACYNTAVTVYCAEQFHHHGAGRVMGLLTTVFCLANTLIALGGGLLSLLDTRYVLWLGAAFAAAALALLSHQRPSLTRVC